MLLNTYNKNIELFIKETIFFKILSKTLLQNFRKFLIHLLNTIDG